MFKNCVLCLSLVIYIYIMGGAGRISFFMSLVLTFCRFQLFSESGSASKDLFPPPSPKYGAWNEKLLGCSCSVLWGTALHRWKDIKMMDCYLVGWNSTLWTHEILILNQAVPGFPHMKPSKFLTSVLLLFHFRQNSSGRVRTCVCIWRGRGTREMPVKYNSELC